MNREGDPQRLALAAYFDWSGYELLATNGRLHADMVRVLAGLHPAPRPGSWATPPCDPGFPPAPGDP